MVENILSPKLADLSKHLTGLAGKLTEDEEISEVSSMAAKVAGMADSIDAIKKEYQYFFLLGQEVSDD